MSIINYFIIYVSIGFVAGTYLTTKHWIECPQEETYGQNIINGMFIGALCLIAWPFAVMMEVAETISNWYLKNKKK